MRVFSNLVVQAQLSYEDLKIYLNPDFLDLIWLQEAVRSIFTMYLH